MKFVFRWLATAIAVGAAFLLVPGIQITGSAETWIAVTILGLFLSLINISIKPIAQTLSLPLSILTLGIFYLVVNTLMLYLATWCANALFGVGILIMSFGSAFVASIVISIVSAIVNGIIGKDD